MKIIGLTGSIATGKTFVTEIFKQNKIKTFHSDSEVFQVLKDNNIIKKIREKKILSSSVQNNSLDKSLLSKLVFNNIEALKSLEDIIHPIIEKKIVDFIKENIAEKIIILDIPLLFEKKYQTYCKKIITTFCSSKSQKERVMRRSNIDEDRYNFILKQQISGDVKAALSNYLVYTDISKEYTKLQVEKIIIKETL